MNINHTLQSCLREINHLSRRLLSFDAVLERLSVDDISTDENNFAVSVLNELQLEPVLDTECTSEKLRQHCGSPVLLKLENENWVCFSSFRLLKQEEYVILFDPTVNTDSKIIQVPTSIFERSWKGVAIFLNGFSNIGFCPDSRLTAFYCLCAIAKNKGVNIAIEEVIHDFPTQTMEPSWGELKKVASKYGFKCEKHKIPLENFDKLGDAIPAIVLKKDGTYAVFCGLQTEKDVTLYAVWDPTLPKNSYDNIKRYTADEYRDVFASEMVFLKKVYSFTDIEQPFSLSWFIPEFLRQKKYFSQVIVAVLVLSVIALVIPLFFQIVVDKVLVHESYNTLNVLGIGVVCALAFSAAMEFFRDYLVCFATNKIDIRTTARSFEHLLQLPIAFFEKIPAGVLVKHMQQLDKIRAFLSGSLFFSVLELITLFVFIPLMWIYSAKLTIIVLLYSLLIASIIFILIKPFQKRLRSLYEAEGKRQSMLVETIHGIRTVKTLALEPVQSKKWNDISAFSIDRYFSVNKISLSARSISRFLEQLMAVNIIWIGALDVFDHTMTIGALIAFQMLSGRVTGPIVKMIGLLHEYQQTALSVQMLGTVMNHPVESVGGEIRPALDGQIELKDIDFKYSPEAEFAIKSLNLNISAGSVVGVVGKSGSGKTTLTKLLQGLYPLQSGIIKLSGVDLREISRSFLRSQIGVVLQDNFFFSGTIKENLLVAKSNATMEEMIIAVRLAGIEEFIQKQPKGFDTALEENATNLSGGQRQRLAIARALLPNPQILIFDEATSALDPESEEIIRANLRQISYGRTVIIVSHRLSMVTEADNIIVLDNGKISESGKHSELLQKHGIYRDFWIKQGGRI